MSSPKKNVLLSCCFGIFESYVPLSYKFVFNPKDTSSICSTDTTTGLFGSVSNLKEIEWVESFKVLHLHVLFSSWLQERPF